jgi:hypothetical protein
MELESFTLRPLYPRGNIQRYQLNRMLGGNLSPYGGSGEGISCPAAGIDPRFRRRAAVVQVQNAVRQCLGERKEYDRRTDKKVSAKEKRVKQKASEGNVKSRYCPRWIHFQWVSPIIKITHFS